ncbi:MAG: diguanylate cyclase [Sulfuricurvum sp.]|jgi:diguanylate cyclase (GGDEF)-like protein/PAS domain S-box-containing protein
MKKYIPSILITITTFIILSVVLLTEYSFSNFEKIIFIIAFSIVTAYLFHLKTNTEQMIKKLIKAEKISKIGFWSLDLTQNSLFWSDEIFDIFEIDPKKFKPSYEEFLNAVHPDDRNLVNDTYTKSLENKESYKLEHRLLLNDGRIKWVKEECETDFDADGNPLISIGIVTDITKDVEHLDKIKKSEFTLNSIINATDDLLFFKDKDFNYLGCNEAFLKFVGKTKEDMLNHNDFELFSEDLASLFREMDTKMLEKNEISSNCEWIKYPNGEEKYLITKKIPFHYNEEDIGILGISRDITELHLSQQKIKAQSYIDELTKLHNRKSYNERIEELVSLKKRYGTPFSMIMYDIDNFKSVNDTYGHKVGDNVLLKMSELIKSLLRETDYIFRIGGEEFIILLTETNLESAIPAATKICKSVEENLIHITNNPITISIGLSEVNESDSEETIFKRADELLYKSKNSGKNKVSY